ncbi:MAG: hypothetical protein LBT49_05530 [Prevotellaceae bacterium]|jgi:hypothetical protein|nr:hypothetical protein [Prevotellaceae bacterium]
MNFYEKAGDLAIDIAKIVIGGVIIGAIMMDNTNTIISWDSFISFSF